MRMGGILALALAIAFVGTTPVFAENNAAVVLKDADHPSGCSLSLGGVPLFTTENIHTVATNSGNVKLTCHFDIPEGFEPPTVLRFTGFACEIFLPDGSTFTTNTRALRTPGGKATLVCQVKANQL